MIDDHDRGEWVNVSSGTGSPGCPGQNPESHKTVLLLARRSMSEALMLQAFCLDHLSVRSCEQWPPTSTYCHAVWGGECGRARKRCTRFCW